MLSSPNTLILFTNKITLFGMSLKFSRGDTCSVNDAEYELKNQNLSMLSYRVFSKPIIHVVLISPP